MIDRDAVLSSLPRFLSFPSNFLLLIDVHKSVCGMRYHWPFWQHHDLQTDSIVQRLFRVSSRNDITGTDGKKNQRGWKGFRLLGENEAQPCWIIPWKHFLIFWCKKKVSEVSARTLRTLFVNSQPASLIQTFRGDASAGTALPTARLNNSGRI